MGFGFDLNAMKQEAAKAASDEKAAVLGYMKRYCEALHGALRGSETAEACDAIIKEAEHDSLISPQTFVAFCVWAFA